MTRPASLSAVSVVAIALVLASCSSGEKKSQSDTTARAGGTSSPTPGATAAAASTGRLSGTLGKPIDAYSGDELYALAHGLSFTGGVDRDRRCAGRGDCDGATPATRTRVRVDAVADEDSLGPGVIPPNGIIAARALNRGGAKEALYGMQPGARYEYYLVLLPDSGNAVKWRLEELDVAGAKRSHRSLGMGPFVECHHPFVRGARADFKTCAQAAAAHPASFNRAMSALLPQGSQDPPLWIGCMSGCCTADPTGGT